MTGRPSSARAVPVPSGRLSRLARLGALGASVAGNMAADGLSQIVRGRRPAARDLFLSPANIARVTEQLAQMRGAAMKVGQMVSMDAGDILPPELAGILAQLRQDAHFMPPAQLKQVLNANWPEGWLRAFRRFDVQPVAAASIGQVHRAELRDGRSLAVKVQYPGVAGSIDSDVANVGGLLRMSGLLPEGFELQPYLDAARRQLHEETDYQREARYFSAFAALLGGDQRYAVPDVLHDWTTSDILAMSFVDGVPVEGLANAPQAMRDRIAGDLIDLLLSELFEFGLVQTDPNFANYRFDAASGRIGLLDFGATRRLDPGLVARYRALMAAGLADDRDGLRAAAADIGFLTPQTRACHADRILGIVASVFAETCRAEVFDFGATDMPLRIQRAALSLAEDGFVPPPLPMDALYLQRKFGGIFLLASRLGARVPVRAKLEAHLGSSHRQDATGAARSGGL